MPSFQVHRRIKIIFVVTYISSARRATSFRCRYTNCLNSANNRGVRNVPLPVGRVSVRRQSAMTSSADQRSVLPVHHTICIYTLVKWRHTICGHDTIAILWVYMLQCWGAKIYPVIQIKLNQFGLKSVHIIDLYQKSVSKRTTFNFFLQDGGKKQLA